MTHSRAEMLDWVREGYVEWKTAKEAGDDVAKKIAAIKLAKRLARANAPFDLLEDLQPGELEIYYAQKSIH